VYSMTVRTDTTSLVTEVMGSFISNASQTAVRLRLSEFPGLADESTE
jgi:hypothetical protein